MRDANQLINHQLISPTETASAQQPKSSSNLDGSLKAEKIFRTLMSEVVPRINQYHHDFAAKFGRVLEGHMREFARQIILENLDVEDVYRGLDRIPQRAKCKPFSPNPVEFVELCKVSVEDLGLPTMDAVYKEIDQYNRHVCRSPKPFKYSHRMVELIAKDIGFDFRLASEEKRQAMLKKSYDKWLDVARKSGLPEPVQRIARHVEPRPVYEQFGYGPDHPQVKAFLDRVKKSRQRAA